METCLGTATTTHLVFEGDSLTQGTTVNPGEAYPELLMKNTIRAWNSLNLAIGGSTTTSMTARAAAATAFLVPASMQVLVVWIGTNDLMANTDSAATIMARITTYVNAMKAAGVKKVIGFTVLPVNPAAPAISGLPGTATHETRRLALNTLIRAQKGGLFNDVVDVAADPFIGNPALTTDLLWYSDGVHLTAFAYKFSLLPLITPKLTSV